MRTYIAEVKVGSEWNQVKEWNMIWSETYNNHATVWDSIENWKKEFGLLFCGFRIFDQDGVIESIYEER